MEVKEEDIMDTIMRDQDQDLAAEEEPQTTYKSYKKKYRKMRAIFDMKMQESNQNFVDEQKALDTIKRITRFNSQTLQLLLDVNNSAQIPADKRFDLIAAHPDLKPIPPLITPSDFSQAAELTTPEGKALYAELVALFNESEATRAASLTASKSLAGLMNSTPHLTLKDPLVNSKLKAELQGHSERYMTMDQIDEHLFEVDTKLGIASTTQPPTLSTTAVHLDLALDNPHSVYNWLRNNKPQVFLQDGEGSEKSSGKPGALRGAGKRIPPPAPSKLDVLEFVEEDGAGYDGLVPASKATKRKRGAGSGVGGGDEDDGGYHPKAGRVEDGKGKKPRQPRKKKEDGAVGSARKRAKKAAAPVEAVAEEGSAFGGD